MQRRDGLWFDVIRKGRKIGHIGVAAIGCLHRMKQILGDVFMFHRFTFEQWSAVVL